MGRRAKGARAQVCGGKGCGVGRPSTLRVWRCPSPRAGTSPERSELVVLDLRRLFELFRCLVLVRGVQLSELRHILRVLFRPLLLHSARAAPSFSSLRRELDLVSRRTGGRARGCQARGRPGYRRRRRRMASTVPPPPAGCAEPGRRVLRRAGCADTSPSSRYASTASNTRPRQRRAPPYLRLVAAFLAAVVRGRVSVLPTRTASFCVAAVYVSACGTNFGISAAGSASAGGAAPPRPRRRPRPS